MNDTDTTTPEPIVDPLTSAQDAVEAQDKDSGGGLRKQLEKALEENRGLKADKRDEILAGIGLDPETGLGKALAEKFDAGDATIENLAEIATNQYGHVVLEGEHPMAQQIAQGQKQIDEVGKTAGSIAAPSQSDALAKAEAEGDYATTMAIKGQQMADMLKTRR